MPKQQTNIKAAIVDIPWILKQLPSFVSAQAEQQKNVMSLQEWVNSANAEINAQKDAAKQQALSAQFQQELAKRQQIAQQAYAQKLQQIDAEVSKMIADTASEQGFDFVFAKTTLVFGGTDISDKVAQKITPSQKA